MRRCRWKRGTAKWSGCSCRAGIQTWQVAALLSADVKLGSCCGDNQSSKLTSACTSYQPPHPTGLKGAPPRRGITMEEVKQHRSKDDAWLAVNGKVGASLPCHRRAAARQILSPGF
jgi:hypothetical protein